MNPRKENLEIMSDEVNKEMNGVPIPRKKIIFLDVDGVLNYTKWYIDDRNPGNLYGQEGDIDPLCVQRIIDVCNVTGAKIVISSDWRTLVGGIPRLIRAGIPEELIIGQTPELIKRCLNFYDADVDTYAHSRGREIDFWLEDNPDTWDYVIIDDRIDFSESQKRLHFVHTDSMYGFTDEDKEKAIEILNR